MGEYRVVTISGWRYTLALGIGLIIGILAVIGLIAFTWALIDVWPHMKEARIGGFK